MRQAIREGKLGAYLRAMLHHPFKLLLFAVASNVVYSLLFMVIEGRGFGASLWWSWVTAFTVGYGDITPVSALGRGLAVLNMATNLLIIQVLGARIVALIFVEDVLDPKEQALLLYRQRENSRVQCEFVAWMYNMEAYRRSPEGLCPPLPPAPVFETDEEVLKKLGF